MINQRDLVLRRQERAECVQITVMAGGVTLGAMAFSNSGLALLAGFFTAVFLAMAFSAHRRVDAIFVQAVEEELTSPQEGA